MIEKRGVNLFSEIFKNCYFIRNPENTVTTWRESVSIETNIESLKPTNKSNRLSSMFSCNLFPLLIPGAQNKGIDDG